jgi:hypothetical protein
MKTITYEQVKAIQARSCTQAERFLRIFGYSAEITAENIRIAVNHGLDVGWVCWSLCRVFLGILKNPLDEYRKAIFQAPSMSLEELKVYHELLLDNPENQALMLVFLKSF